MCDTPVRLLSTKQIAAALGVGESSVKRWIDAGTLPAQKTPGGHRRVTVVDFYAFLHASGRNLVSPDALGLSGQAAATSSPFDACLASLTDGDAFAFESALQLLRLSEPQVATAIDKVLYPAFKSLRQTCVHPSEECLLLHRALAMIQIGLRATMRPMSPTNDARHLRVVLADVGYEVDGVPTNLAEAAVWDVAKCLQLGTNVPAPVVEGALTSFDADVLWLSGSGPARRSVVNAACDSIVRRATECGVKVVLFGDSLPSKVDGAATRVSTFAEFRSFVAALA